MKVKSGLIEAEGMVKKIEKSLIPKVYILSIDCDEISIKLDLVKDLLIFDEGDRVNVLISHEKPKFKEGQDLVIWGYVLSKKKTLSGEKPNKLLISLWGYLLVIETLRSDIIDAFDYLDKVYFKLSKKNIKYRDP